MFKKLKRKIKEKIAVKKLRKECFSAITFNKNTVIKEKSVLIIELNPYHAETIAGHCKYFSDLGYNVDVFMHFENFKEYPLCRYIINPPRVFVGTENELKKWGSFKILSQYDFIFFNSCTYKCGTNIFNKFKKIVSAKYGFLGVEHDVLSKNCAIFPEINEALSENRLFVLSDIQGIPRLNPHYFGNIKITSKHKDTIIFTAVGVIDSSVKNHQMLFDGIQVLLKQGITNFKIVVIGSGKLEIPQNLQQYIEMRGRLNFPDMYDAIEKTDFLLGLMDINNLQHHRYLNGQASGIVQLSLGFRKPLIINSIFGTHYEFSDKTAILYNGNALGKVMTDAYNMAVADYDRMQSNLSELADNIYKQSLGDLEQAINLSKCKQKNNSKMALMCKTYRRNLLRLKTLKQSIDEYNKDDIPFYIVAPQNDIALIQSSILTGKESYNIQFFSDEEFLGEDTLNDGWLNHQIVKLRFYKANVCDFYLMIDSDSYFIKNFYVSDFMYDETTPYIVCREGKDAKLINNKCGNSDMFSKEQTVRSFFGRKGKNYRFLTTPIMFSNEVCKELDEKYNASELIKTVSCEAAWHGEYLLANKTVNFMPCEPFFKAMVYEKQYKFYKKLKITLNDIKKLYLGIVMQDHHIKSREKYE